MATKKGCKGFALSHYVRTPYSDCQVGFAGALIHHSFSTYEKNNRDEKYMYLYHA